MLFSRHSINCSLALFSVLLGAANFAVAGTITSIVPTPPYYGGLIDPPGPSATGANFAGAELIDAYGNNAYNVGVAFWSQSGDFAGGASAPGFTISLSGDSRSQAFQITNTGNAYLYWLDINAAAFTNANVVFDVSSSVAYGSTTDSMNGVVNYRQPEYIVGQPASSSTPYFSEVFIQFDQPGLSPGASATIFADADVATPEPGTAALMAAAFIILTLLTGRTIRSSQQQ